MAPVLLVHDGWEDEDDLALSKVDRPQQILYAVPMACVFVAATQSVSGYIHLA
jgi:hypothetical protein